MSGRHTRRHTCNGEKIKMFPFIRAPSFKKPQYGAAGRTMLAQAGLSTTFSMIRHPSLMSLSGGRLSYHAIQPQAARLSQQDLLGQSPATTDTAARRFAASVVTRVGDRPSALGPAV